MSDPTPKQPDNNMTNKPPVQDDNGPLRKPMQYGAYSSDDSDTEAVAMNIVFQIGDVLYEALPKDIAHNHFVTARQATNDKAIDFAVKRIHLAQQRAVLEGRIGELERLHRFEGEGLAPRDYDNSTDELIDERLDELTIELKKLEGTT